MAVLASAALLCWWASAPWSAGPATGAALSGAPPVKLEANVVLRVATYNVHGLRDADGQDSFDAIAAQIGDLDIVGLNELHADGFILPPASNQARQLGDRLRMPYLFAPAERSWLKGEFGNGLLCRLPVRWWQRIPLSGTEGGHSNVLLAAVRGPGGQELTVLVTHVDRTANRVEQLRAVIRLFRTVRPPAILMGDLNTRADDPDLARLLADPNVRPAPALTALDGRIDWILVRGLTVLSGEVGPVGPSDHPPVRAVLRLP